MSDDKKMEEKPRNFIQNKIDRDLIEGHYKIVYRITTEEIVSELLGHSNMNITQLHYGKVVQKKVSEQMNALSKKLSEK